ncbi:MAG: hypothetical protein F4Z15_00735, partial [Gammaproteobacteria bacterium]|nr:hypothetical protein [Gammaproteobacteria bacterium]
MGRYFVDCKVSSCTACPRGYRYRRFPGFVPYGCSRGTTRRSVTRPVKETAILIKFQEEGQMTSDETFISIMGDSVPAQHQEMNIWELSFLSDNPRVYAAIKEIESFSSLTTDEQQHCIYKRILQEPSVKNLIPEIKRDGGLQEPIIVRYDTRQVIEGNSRLAVYRKLYRDTHENEQWRSIRCLVVKSLPDDQQTRLLGQTHLRGKTEWSAHAKALFCYRWVEEKKKEEAELAKLSGFKANEIKKHAKA